MLLASLYGNAQLDYVIMIFEFQVDSCEDTRENTPDSDSGYVGSVVTVTSTSRTFNPRPPVEAAPVATVRPMIFLYPTKFHHT